MVPPNPYGYDVPLDFRLLQTEAINDDPNAIESLAMVPPNPYGYDVPLDYRLV